MVDVKKLLHSKCATTSGLVPNQRVKRKVKPKTFLHHRLKVDNYDDRYHLTLTMAMAIQVMTNLLKSCIQLEK